MIDKKFEVELNDLRDQNRLDPAKKLLAELKGNISELTDRGRIMNICEKTRNDLEVLFEGSQSALRDYQIAINVLYRIMSDRALELKAVAFEEKVIKVNWTQEEIFELNQLQNNEIKNHAIVLLGDAIRQVSKFGLTREEIKPIFEEAERNFVLLYNGRAFARNDILIISNILSQRILEIIRKMELLN